jgi:hypothetical protein
LPSTAGGAGGSGAQAGSSNGGGSAAGAGKAGYEGTVWPGANAVQSVDLAPEFTGNLSGLTYQPASSPAPAVLWGVVNGPGTLFRLLWNGTSYASDTQADWGAGKLLRYPDGTGNPDAEGVTLGADLADGVYVAAEHDNDSSSTSRLSVLRYDAAVAASSLTATNEWNLTSVLPKVDANLGLEAITWVPDVYLTRKGFYDEAKRRVYAPSDYTDHGAGLFFVGLEGNGTIYAFALSRASGASSLLATISTENAGVMGLEFDRDVGYLWYDCDDTCANETGVLDIDTTPGSTTLGHFVLLRQFERPTSLPNANNEGIAIAPEAECVAGYKPFFWADDDDTDNRSLRRDSIPCGAFL